VKLPIIRSTTAMVVVGSPAPPPPCTRWPALGVPSHSRFRVVNDEYNDPSLDVPLSYLANHTVYSPSNWIMHQHALRL